MSFIYKACYLVFIYMLLYLYFHIYENSLTYGIYILYLLFIIIFMCTLILTSTYTCIILLQHLHSTSLVCLYISHIVWSDFSYDFQVVCIKWLLRWYQIDILNEKGIVSNNFVPIIIKHISHVTMRQYYWKSYIT